ncbi:hypothetical protein CR513_10567, partial [Mucuna pruriens]
MRIPPRFESHDAKNKVCKLRKAFYDFKQSPQAWFGRFTQVMISLGYKQSQFIEHFFDGKLTLLPVYVDDMIIVGLQVANVTKELPSARFRDLIGKLGMIYINLPT